jgi:hypothetical protein
MDDDTIESAQDADRLDRLLNAVAAPAVPAALERRIMADFDRVQRHAEADRMAARWTFARALRRLADAVWPGAPVWQPACAFALALLIGTGVAAFAPLDLPQQDDGGTLALGGPPDIDIGQGI